MDNSKDEYNKFSSDFLKHLYEDSFLEVVKRTKQIETEHEHIIERLCYLNGLVSDHTKSQENYKKCLEYYQKALRIKRDLVTLNENCIQLKKRAINLKENAEEKKTRSILERERLIEEEKKLYPVFKPQNLINSSAKPASPSQTPRPTSSQFNSGQVTEGEPSNKSASVPEASIASNVTTLKLTKKPRHKPKIVEPSTDASSSK